MPSRTHLDYGECSRARVRRVCERADHQRKLNHSQTWDVPIETSSGFPVSGCVHAGRAVLWPLIYAMAKIRAHVSLKQCMLLWVGALSGLGAWRSLR